MLAQLSAALLSLLLAPVPQGDDLSELVRRMDQGEPSDSSAARGMLEAQGAGAAAALLEGFSGVELEARRRRAELLRLLADDASVPGVLALMADSDLEVQGSLIGFLGRQDLPGESAGARSRGLGELAERDVRPESRQRARAALGGLVQAGHPAAAEALDELIDRLPREESVLAALRLGGSPAGNARVIARVQRGFRALADPMARLQPVDDGVLAILLSEAYGAALAETPGGGESPEDRIPWVLGARHPDPTVQLAAETSLDRFVARARFLGESERIDSVLEGLQNDGYRVLRVWLQRGLQALETGKNPEDAARAARALSAVRGTSDPALDHEPAERWRWRGEVLHALAEIAADRPDGALGPLEEARRLAELRVRRRDDLSGDWAEQVRALNQRALLEVLEIVRLLASGATGSDTPVLEAARRAHTWQLRGQLRAVEASENASFGGWDVVLGYRFAPAPLLFDRGQLEAWSRERGIATHRDMLRALSTVAPGEVPGFTPFEVEDEALSSPLTDPERLELLQRIRLAQLRQLERMMGAMGRAGADPRQIAVVRAALRDLRSKIDEGEAEGYRSLLSLRTPSEVGLSVAELLREEGRVSEGRELLERMGEDLEAAGERSGMGFDDPYLQARIETGIGTALSDSGEPERAAEVLAIAVQRLEDFERSAPERGLQAAAIRQLQALRASALVSMAVNANVKLGRQEEALEHFEAAYRLRQDDFMRVLLACYRARAGRIEEARALVRDLPASPSLRYNLACTHALLGDVDEALEHLRLDLYGNHPSDGSLRRQQDWAREDPDLEGLRGDPRFELLLNSDREALSVPR